MRRRGNNGPQATWLIHQRHSVAPITPVQTRSSWFSICRMQCSSTKGTLNVGNGGNRSDNQRDNRRGSAWSCHVGESDPRTESRRRRWFPTTTTATTTTTTATTKERLFKRPPGLINYILTTATTGLHRSVTHCGAYPGPLVHWQFLYNLFCEPTLRR